MPVIKWKKKCKKYIQTQIFALRMKLKYKNWGNTSVEEGKCKNKYKNFKANKYLEFKVPY